MLQVYRLRAYLCLLLLVAAQLHAHGANDGAARLDSATRAREAPLRARVLAVGRTQVGVREATGRNDGAQVQKYLASIGLKGNYAWCSAYIVWIFRTAGVPVPRFGRARSWFDAAHTVWAAGRQVPGRPAPQPGDLVGFRWGNPAIAHVGILEIWGSGPTCQTNEGNTSGGKAERDGEGSFINWRSKWMVSAVANPISRPRYTRGE